MYSSLVTWNRSRANTESAQRDREFRDLPNVANSRSRVEQESSIVSDDQIVIVLLGISRFTDSECLRGNLLYREIVVVPAGNGTLDLLFQKRRWRTCTRRCKGLEKNHASFDQSPAEDRHDNRQDEPSTTHSDQPSTGAGR